MTDLATEIKDVLFPDGDRDHEWNTEMLEEIATIVTRDEPIPVTFTREEAGVVLDMVNARRFAGVGGIEAARQRAVEKVRLALNGEEKA